MDEVTFARVDVRARLPAPLAEIMPGAEASLPPAHEVPSQYVSASFWVEDGELQRGELDLAQFLGQPAGHFMIRLEAADGEPIEAPDDAVVVDMEELVEMSGATPGQLLGGLVGAGGTEVEATAAAISMTSRCTPRWKGCRRWWNTCR